MQEWPRSSERIEFLNMDQNKKQTFFDLSATGVCCLSAKAKEAGAEVLVAINDLRVRAKVAYSQQRTDGFRVGLKFLEGTPEKKDALKKIVDGFSKGVPVNCSIIEQTK
jgi:hypothetical protein